MPAIDDPDAWPDDPTGDATMLATLLVFLSVLIELSIELPLAPGVWYPTPTRAVGLMLDEGWLEMCSAELLPREDINGPSDVREGRVAELPPADDAGDVGKVNGGSEVSKAVAGRGEAVVPGVSRLPGVGGMRDVQAGSGGGDPVGWILAPALTLADGS